MLSASSVPGTRHVSESASTYAAFSPVEYAKGRAAASSSAAAAAAAATGPSSAQNIIHRIPSAGAKKMVSHPSQYVSSTRSDFCRHPAEEYQHHRQPGEQIAHRDIGDVRHVGSDHFVSSKQEAHRRFPAAEYQQRFGKADLGEFKARHVDKEHFTSSARFTYKSYAPAVYKEALHKPGGNFNLSALIDAAKTNYRPTWHSDEQITSTSRSTYVAHPTEELMAKRQDLASLRQPYCVRRVGEQHFQTSQRRDFTESNHPP